MIQFTTELYLYKENTAQFHWLITLISTVYEYQKLLYLYLNSEFIIDQMQSQQAPPAEVKAVILLEVDHVFMHRLVKKQKTLFTSGTLKIAKLDNGKPNSAYFINIGSFYYGIHQNLFFIKVVYPDTVSYVFPHFQSGLSALSLLADSPSIANFQEIIQNVTRLFQYSAVQEQPQLKNLIEQHYPPLQKQQIYYPDSIKKVITTSGKLFNTVFTVVGGYVKSGVEKAGNYLNSKIQQGQPTQIKPQTKQKWQTLKNGTSKAIQVSSDFANKIFTPVLTKASQYTNQIKTSIDQSQNQKVKYAKQLVQISGKAIQQAFEGLIKSGTEVTKQLGEQSKKIITKKYGEDIIKTLTSEKEQSSIEKVETAPVSEQSQVRLQESSQKLQYPSLQK